MKDKALMLAMLLIVVGAVCFVTAPVFSGEHPWDSDRGGDEFDDPPPDDPRFGDTIPDSTIVIVLTTPGDGSETKSTTETGTWDSWTTAMFMLAGSLSAWM